MLRRIGIYGGGQLGAYLCQSARSLGFITTVIAPGETDPAVHYADHVIQAPLSDLDATRELIMGSDVLTFELEEIDEDVLNAITQATIAGTVEVAPGCETLQLLQNKYEQKRWLASHGFPTSPFVRCASDTTMAELAGQFGLPFVQKARRGGYDGRGVQIIRSLDDEPRLWRLGAFAEQYVGEKRELAVLVARSAKGQLAVYPVMEMLFDDVGNIVRRVISPATVKSRLAERAETLARNVVTSLNGVGLFTVEMFASSTQGLLVNEIAPRVHNAGHLTIEAHETSQYEQHIRAITGLPLGPTIQARPAVMVNILNEPLLNPAFPSRPGVTKIADSTHIHWYGKTATKSFRKLGHITSIAKNLQAATESANSAINSLSLVPQ
ncbi:MAG: 5-(carboxyamino)imidazole ribonucleotide synthase [Gammaproteobacteria bacterium]|jgi:5-(carboxyamino)imidazole ribonucleotide synthase